MKHHSPQPRKDRIVKRILLATSLLLGASVAHAAPFNPEAFDGGPYVTKKDLLNGYFNRSGALTAPVSIVRPGATRPTLLSQYIADRSYSVSDFGANPSTQTTTGSIAAGNNVLTVSSAVDFAVGQGVAVSTGPNTYFVANITAVSGNTLILDASAPSSLSSASVQHDNTDAINGCIAYVTGSGGGTCYFPKGIYNVNKPTADATHSANGFDVIKFPDISFTSQPVTVNLQGQNTGIVAYAEDQPTVPSNGVIIYSQLRDTAYGSSLLYAQHGSAGANGVAPITVNLSNMTFREAAGTTGPSLTAINLEYAANTILQNVAVDVDAPNYQAPKPQIAGILGINMPNAGNYGTVMLNNVYVTDYMGGISLSEHANLNNVFLQYDMSAFVTLGGNYANELKNTLIQECDWSFTYQSGWTQLMGSINVEAASTTAGWWGFKGFVSSSSSGHILGNLAYILSGYGGIPENDEYPYLLFTTNAGDKSPLMNIPVTGSPFSYMAWNAGNIVINGGSISSITLNRLGTTISLPATAQIIPVSKHDTVTVTYTNAPTETFMP